MPDLWFNGWFQLVCIIFVDLAKIKLLCGLLGFVSSVDHLADMVSGTKDNGGVYFVPAFSGLGVSPLIFPLNTIQYLC